MNAQALFNPDLFLETQIDAPLSTAPVLLPVGTFISQITGVKARETPGTKDPSKKFRFLDIEHTVDCSQIVDDGTGRSIKDITNRDQMKVQDSILLDLTESGTLDFRDGMNFRLGRIREALGQNVAGQVWGPKMLLGQVLKIEIGHRADPQDASVVYTQVKGVEKA